MKITDALLGEHGAFYPLFDRIESGVPGSADARDVQDQAALLGAALVTHARLEDELLFSALLANGADPGMMAEMTSQHERIAGLLDLAGREATGLEEARDALLEAVSLAREHFAIEERLAFPLAEATLGNAALRALGESWARRRTVWLDPVP